MAEIHGNGAAAETVPLRSIFSTDCVLTISRDTDKSRAIRQLVERLAATGKLPQSEVDRVVDGLIERERLGTTAVGKGLAIPHLRTGTVGRSVGAIGVAPEGIEFESLDGLPTRLVILLLSPSERRQQHTETLGRIARLFCDGTLQYRVQIPRTAEALFSFLDFD